MKKKILLFTAIAGVASLALMSYRLGAGNAGGYNCTGAETDSGNPAGCSTGSSCHANTATAGIAVTVELDSAGVPVTHYVGGHAYTVKISGTNNTGISLPKFGFQVSAMTGTTATATPTNAGTFASTGLPTSVRYTPNAGAGSFLLNCVEQSNDITATSGTGGAGTTYVESFGWTAPTSGTGTISIWGALNAVNGNTTNDTGDHWNTAHIMLSEEAPAAVANVVNNIAVNVFPNPCSNALNVNIDNASGTYELNVFDLSGRAVAHESVSGNTVFNTTSWAAGMYYLSVSANGASKVYPVVKQ